MSASQKSKFAVARRCSGIKARDWPNWVRTAVDQGFLSAEESFSYLQCKFGRNSCTCHSPLCPRCYIRRVWRFVERLYVGLEESNATVLVLDRDDYVRPFDRTQRLARKARSRSPVDWQYYDRADFAAHLHEIAVHEQQVMQDNSRAVRPRATGVLSWWTIWPLRYGWFVSRVRIVAYKRRNVLPCPLRQSRCGQINRSRQVVLVCSPESLFPFLVDVLKQPRGLCVDDQQIIPAASLLLTSRLVVKKQHARGVFHGLDGIRRRRPQSSIEANRIEGTNLPIPLQRLYELGITVRRKQLYWLEQFIQMSQLFPEITFEMFCERLKSHANICTDVEGPLSIPVKHLLKNRFPRAKQSDRIALLSEYCVLREQMLERTGKNATLDAFLEVEQATRVVGPRESPTSVAPQMDEVP